MATLLATLDYRQENSWVLLTLDSFFSLRLWLEFRRLVEQGLEGWVQEDQE